MRNILLGSLALILGAGLVACEDSANGEANEGAEADSAVIQEALPEADVLKPADPNIPELDLSQPAPIIAGPSADTGEADMDGTDMDGTDMDGTGMGGTEMPGEGMMPGEEGGLDQVGAPEGAPGEGISPIDAGEEPRPTPVGEEPGAAGAGMDEAPAEEDIGTEEMERE
jgi:hypothetical protein